MLTLFVFLTGLGVFVTFIIFCTIMFNHCVKKSSLYRTRHNIRTKSMHNLYVMAYSSIFSTMLMASVCFPMFAKEINEPIRVDIPTAIRIIELSTDDVISKIKNSEGINIFNEVNNIVIRFENEQVFN